MAIKMRVLYATNKKKMINIANYIKQKYELTQKSVDCVPPAYSCEREKLVIMVVSATSSMPNAFDLFCKSLNKQNAYNVAIISDGTPENTVKIVDMIKGAGGNVLDDILYINGGLPFKFLKNVPAEDMAKVNEWSDRIVASVSSNG